MWRTSRDSFSRDILPERRHLVFGLAKASKEREAGQPHQAEKKEHNRDASGRGNLQAPSARCVSPTSLKESGPDKLGRGQRRVRRETLRGRVREQVATLCLTEENCLDARPWA